MKKILVMDDEESFADGYAKKLRGIKNVNKDFEIISDFDIAGTLAALTKRQRLFREGKKITGSRDAASTLDDAKIAIIDYDLVSRGETSDSFVSGEDICYLVRCFTTCGLIVGLNQFERNPFDLTLKGHPESYADLNIGSIQVDNSGLWGGVTDGFRPWYWPNLLEFQMTFDKRVADVKNNLDKSIAHVLGIEDEIQFMPSSIRAFLSGNAAKTTFREFALNSGNGLRAKDKLETAKIGRSNDALLARIAAARISKWIERMIFPGQDILIDAPHLISHFPSILKGKASSLGTWNRTATSFDIEELGIDHESIKKFSFKKRFWLSRPAWLWRGLVNSQDILEVRDPWKREPSKYVFCEDESRFHLKTACRRFRANLDSMYTTRYVRMRAKGVDYEPKVNLFAKAATIEEPDRE